MLYSYTGCVIIVLQNILYNYLQGLTRPGVQIVDLDLSF